MPVTVTKRFGPFPAAHRQPDHDGHCRFIHGHSYHFDLEFGCNGAEEKTGFVYDFGKMKAIKFFLELNFDHTLLITEKDPQFDAFSKLEAAGAADLRVVPNSSAEGLAEFVWHQVSNILFNETQGRVFLVSVICFEEQKASAKYLP